MKIIVDYEKCESHGQCEHVCPEVFSLDDEGILSVRQDVPEELRAQVQLAASVCPTLAITVEE